MRQAIVAAVVAILLGVLAVLQYRWLGEVSVAERERMRAHLQSRGADVAQAFDAELTRIYVAFHIDPERLDDDPGAAVEDAFTQWHAGTAYPRVVRAVDLIEHADGPTLRRFDPASGTLASVPWPPAIRDWLSRVTRAVPAATGPPALLLADAVDGIIPALVVTVPKIQKAEGAGSFHVMADPASVARSLLVELDATSLRDEVLAPLVTRYFGAPSDSVVTVVRNDDLRQVVFASDPAMPVDPRSADATTSLFDLRLDGVGDDGNHVGPSGNGRGKVAFTIVRRANPGDGRRLFTGSSLGAWRLLARYRADSLDALVAASRRRNFAVVVAVLVLLGGSVALMMVSAERARRLARQQMEFVASVSHELRTPLAVIRSAGENLADGLVGDPTQIRKYGAVVEAEGRRLGDMVERVLLFAGIGSGARTHAVGEVDLEQVLAAATAAVEIEARERGIHLIERIGRLRQLAGDGEALRSALQNVLANAVKYSADGATVEVTAVAVDEGAVRIQVVDSGIGIDEVDLPHVFKPFFRGRRALDAQVRGTGIGLSVVRHVVRVHGGDVTVASRPGEGTTVTIVLPVRSVAEAAEGRGRVVRLKQAGVGS